MLSDSRLTKIPLYDALMCISAMGKFAWLQCLNPVWEIGWLLFSFRGSFFEYFEKQFWVARSPP
ncbi:MAG TPA: hypothetical protein V6D48_05805 [Oculatellaceae cyanobacterium]